MEFKMTNEQKQVKEWMTAFGQECPEKPTIPSLEVRKLRAKLILEEALETIEALGVRIYGKDGCSGKEFEVSSEYFHCITIEDWKPANLSEIADGCEDLKVVTEGTLVACGLVDKTQSNIGFKHGKDEKDIILESKNDPLFDEVMRSNNAKLWSNSEISAYFGCRVLDNLQVACKEGGYFAKRINENQWLVKDSDGKIIKPISFTTPNLQAIIEKMSK